MELSPQVMLKDAGLKVTPGRTAVLTVLMNAEKPLSSPEIKQKISPLSLDQATIYRILHSLNNSGLVQNVSFGSDKSYWELQSHHHHLRCEKCDKVVNIPECNLHNMEKNLQVQSGFTDIRHSLEYLGTCEECQL